MRCVVDHEWPLEGDFHRPPNGACAKSREQGVGSQEEFPTKAAADVGRDQANLFLLDAERFGHVVDAPGNHLVRGPNCEIVTVPCGDGRMRLHHYVTLIRRCVNRIELNRRGRECAFKIAESRVGRTTDSRFGLSRRLFCGGQVVHAFLGLILDLNQLRGGTCLLKRLCDDHRDRLVIVLNLWSTEQRGGVMFAFAELASILRGNDG